MNYTKLLGSLSEQFGVQLAEAVVLFSVGGNPPTLNFTYTPEEERMAKTWKEEYLFPFEQSGKVPLPTFTWQLAEEKALLKVFKARIEERLKADGVPVNDRVGAIVDSYLDSLALGEYAKYGDIPNSRRGTKIVSECVDAVLTTIHRQPLTLKGQELLKGWKIRHAQQLTQNTKRPGGMEI